MAKAKTKFVCDNKQCNHEESRFFGICPSCNSGFGEEVEIAKVVQKGKVVDADKVKVKKSNLINIKDITSNEVNRIDLGMRQLNNLFGGNEKTGHTGIALNSLTLLSGEPGVGKSTLLLQLLEKVSQQGKKSIYFSAEENEEQVKERYDRLGLKEDFVVRNENNMMQILTDGADFDFLIIDSINTMYIENLGVVGGVSQIKECTMLLMDFAKKQNKTIIIIGQVNGEGDIAGPKTLEHMVDTVLFFENFDDSLKYKILTSNKNRFGKVNETVIMQMEETGLEEIVDPSLLFIEEDTESFGSAMSIFLKGNRPIFIEVESLVQSTTAEKTITQSIGIDQKKLFQINAILNKYLGFKSFEKNIFSNVVGGLNLTREKVSHFDLAVVASILSSEFEKNLNDYIFIGEVSLSGKIRKAQREEDLIKYIKSIGLKKTIICNSEGFTNIKQIETLF